MNFDQEKLRLIWRQYYLPLAVGAVGVILMLVGMVSLLVSSKNEGVIFESEEGTSSGALKREMTIDVAGAVVSPGVYRLRSDARVQDALISAGGLSNEADREWVAKVLNLAGKLTDGQKIYIPDKGITHSASSGQAGSAGITSTTGNNVRDSLININAASQAELEALPGIGPVTAQKIIGGRSYSDINELRTKKIVGEKVFNQIKDLISVY